MSELSTTIPWIACFVVLAGLSGGLIALLFRALGALDDITKLLADLLGRSSPAVLAPLPAPTVPVRPAPAAIAPPAPVPQPAASADPAWYTWAQGEVGFHETGNNQGIEKYIALGKCGAPGDPWCAIFANAALEASGLPGTRSASSQSFRSHPDFVQLAGPAKGAIAVFWRISKESGQGHVGFYDKEDATHVYTLGGNENDMVQDAPLPKDSAAFGLIGYWWPKSVPLPAIGAIAPAVARPAAPVAVQGRQTGITATVFGGEQSAYGGPINDNAPGVALPFRFSGVRPRVRVTNPKTGSSVDCDIVDVGPWNDVPGDPYWQTGTRPQAESGIDQRGRKTNRAGIDLTVAAATALQIDGKGLVDWEFLQSPTTATSQPNVV